MIVIQAECVGIRHWTQKDGSKARHVTFEWRYAPDAIGVSWSTNLDLVDDEGEFKIGDKVEIRISPLVAH